MRRPSLARIVASALHGTGLLRPLSLAVDSGADDYTARDTRLVREAGFTCAVTTTFGVNTPATSPHELRRGGPWETDVSTFALELLSCQVSRPSSTRGPVSTSVPGVIPTRRLEPAAPQVPRLVWHHRDMFACPACGGTLSAHAVDPGAPVGYRPHHVAASAWAASLGDAALRG